MARNESRIGRWTWYPERRSLECGRVTRHLEPKHADVLSLLASEPGRVVSKRELLETIWGDVVVTEEVLTNAIYQIRRSLGDSARQQSYIQTVPKKGYRLIAEVDPDSKLENDGERVWSSLRLAAAAVLLFVMAGVIAAHTLNGGDDPRSSTALVEKGEAALKAGDASSDAVATRLFEEATRADPRLAPAWSGLATARWRLVSSGEVSKTIGLPLTEEAAKKAIALDGGLWRPWTTLGLVHLMRWEWDEAERALSHGVSLGPDEPYAHSAYAEFLMLTGRDEEARTRISIASRLGPRSPQVLRSAGFIYTMLREDRLAESAYRALLHIDPSDAQARNQLEKLQDPERHAMPGSEITVSKIDQLLRKTPLRPAVVAGMFAEAGEHEKALEWLQRAREERDLSLLLVRLDDRWRRLHGDQRYGALLDVGF